MLKLKFIFNYNSTLKRKNNSRYTVGYTNLIFFFIILKKKFNIENIILKHNFIINKNISFFFNKADFKYKKSKHLLTKFSNIFLIDITVLDNINYSSFLIFYKFFMYNNFLSNVILNLSYYTISFYNKNLNYFLI